MTLHIVGVRVRCWVVLERLGNDPGRGSCFVLLFFAVVGAHVGAALRGDIFLATATHPHQLLPRPGEPIVFLQLVAYTCSFHTHLISP